MYRNPSINVRNIKSYVSLLYNICNTLVKNLVVLGSIKGNRTYGNSWTLVFFHKASRTYVFWLKTIQIEYK